MIGEYCGFSYIERNAFIDYAVKNVGLFKTGNEHKAFWLYYFLNSKIGEFILETNKSGTSQPYITLGSLREFPVLYPPTEIEAFNITNILISLDDKIDLLQRQNKTLEQLAETLFRQWFVNEAEDSWKERNVETFGKIICGKTPSKTIAKYFKGEIPFIKIPDMHEKTFIFETSDTLSKEGGNSQSNKYILPKSICISCIATVGLVSMNAYLSQTNQQINSIIPAKDFYRYFVYLKMKSMKDELLAMASGGTATDNLNTGNFSQIGLKAPDDRVIANFHNEVEIYFEKIFQNQIQIKKLTQLKDVLLPKLMSGEVRVEQPR